jgi:hypothetical protein
VSAVYTKRLAYIADALGSVAAVVPAGKVWIVTDIMLTSANQATVTAFSASAGAAGLFFVDNVPAGPGYTSLHFAAKVVLVAGETLTLATVGNPAWIQATGYELSA